MLELGEQTEAAHREVGEQVAALTATMTCDTLLVTVGPLSEEIARTARAQGRPGANELRILEAPDTASARALLTPFLDQSTSATMLLKASRGIGLEALLDI
jgi:UDP-N-acetylmuramyl pentapeptide synthase